MKKKGVVLLGTVFSVLFCLNSTLAEEPKGDLRARITELRNKKARLSLDYDTAVHELNQDTEAKIAKLKTDYRVGREECLTEKRQTERKLRGDYESNMTLLMKEEDALARAIGPSETSNFSKTRTERGQ